MPIKPEFNEFEQLFNEFDAVPVSRRILADALTPVSAFRRIDDGKDGCLFESVIGGEQVGRYSFLASKPYKEIKATRDRVIITDSSGSTQLTCENPLLKLRELVTDIRVAQIEDLPPFTGGAVGFAGYDVIRYVEHLPNSPTDDRSIPDMTFVFYDRVLVFDHITKTLHIVVLARAQQFDSATEAYADAQKRIDQTIDQLNGNLSNPVCVDVVTDATPIEFQSNFTEAEFKEAVETCVEYIKSGDIFQTVISQRLHVPISVDAFEIYRHLRVLNPSPFMFFLRGGGVTLVGASPEIMCRVVGNEMTVRPLAGTRPRGVDEQQDRELEQELLADEKERAEHAMLVDLGRNDVGKVCEFGSVKLVDPFSIERYSHVMHISSTVNGVLNEGCDEFDAFMASHPAGTVSGAPKVRAMEIIDELEPHRRGPYAGAVGYIDHSGNMDTCIALRTIVIQGNTAYVQAGAGIVADSNPQMEYQETLNKAKALLRAIESAEAGVVK